MASVGLDLLHHLFHVLHRVAIGNQHGVFGLHHHQILHADGGHQAGFGVNVAVFRFMADDVAVVDISSGVWALISHSEDHEPTSLQPASIGITTASAVRSITA